nr:unnamed protein product [Callosobruchus analis]
MHHCCFACFNISKRKIVFYFTSLKNISEVCIKRRPPK